MLGIYATNSLVIIIDLSNSLNKIATGTCWGFLVSRYFKNVAQKTNYIVIQIVDPIGMPHKNFHDFEIPYNLKILGHVHLEIQPFRIISNI